MDNTENNNVSGGKKNMTAVVVVILVIAILGGFYIYKNSKSSSLVSTPQENTANVPETTVPTTVATTSTPKIVEFTVTGKNYSFTPNIISVKKGDTVKITFKDTQGFHDFKIDEFNVATPQIKGGSEAVVQFVADKSGSFQYYCSVGKHRANGMWGTLTVTE